MDTDQPRAEVAASRPPVERTPADKPAVMAHAILVTAFAFQQVSAAVTRLDPAYEQAAASLGARPYYTLLRVKLPLRICPLDDRGHQFVAAVVTAVMMTITLAVLLVLSRIRTRANYREDTESPGRHRALKFLSAIPHTQRW